MGEQRSHVCREDSICLLRQEILLEHRARDLRALGVHVPCKGCDGALRARDTAAERQREVEEVATLLPLVERAELRAQELVELVGADVCITGPILPALVCTRSMSSEYRAAGWRCSL